MRGKGTKNISHTQARGCKGANNYTKKVIFVNFYTNKMEVKSKQKTPRRMGRVFLNAGASALCPRSLSQHRPARRGAHSALLSLHSPPIAEERGLRSMAWYGVGIAQREREREG